MWCSHADVVGGIAVRADPIANVAPLVQDIDQRKNDPAFGMFASAARLPSTVFDLRPIRRALHQIALDKLSPRDSGLLYWADAYDAIVCYREVTPAGH